MKTPIQQAMALISEGTLLQFRRALAEHPHLLPGEGACMLEYAAMNGRVDILEFLIAAGVDVNGVSAHDTPLSATAREGAVETARWLLDHGAEVNARAEPSGSTPLEEAVMEGRLEMVQFLLDRGADPDILDGNPRRNALASARFWGHDDIADFLESRGITEIVIEPEPVDVEAPGFVGPDDPTNPAAWLEKKWIHVYNYAMRHGTAALSEKNRILFLVGYLIDQLADGGTATVYFNPSAEYAADIAVALDKIGAGCAARTIRDLNALFPGGAPSADYESRRAQLAALPADASRLGEELEAIFDEWLPNGGERVLVAQLYDFYHT